MIVLMLGLAVLFGWLAWSTRNSRAEVTPGGSGSWATCGADHPARPLPARRGSRARPSRRAGAPAALETDGLGVGGYASGWFRLQNGEKALIYLTDRRSVAYLPTRDGYSVLLSSHEPERLIAALRGG